MSDQTNHLRSRQSPNSSNRKVYIKREKSNLSNSHVFAARLSLAQLPYCTYINTLFFLTLTKLINDLSWAKCNKSISLHIFFYIILHALQDIFIYKNDILRYGIAQKYSKYAITKSWGEGVTVRFVDLLVELWLTITV